MLQAASEPLGWGAKSNPDVLQKRQEMLDAAAAFQLHRRALLEAWLEGRAHGVRVLAHGPNFNKQLKIESGRWRHLLSVRPTGRTEELKRSLPHNRALVSGGLQMCSVFDGTALGPTARAMLANEPVGDYRLSHCPVQIKVVDGSEVYLQGPSEANGVTVLAARRRDTMEVALQYWKAVLALAVPAQPVDVTPTPFSPRQHQVIALLVDGSTDAQIASVLGISLRTVRSETATIMGRLGVRSRFAAGHVLGALIHMDAPRTGPAPIKRGSSADRRARR